MQLLGCAVISQLKLADSSKLFIVDLTVGSQFLQLELNILKCSVMTDDEKMQISSLLCTKEKPIILKIVNIVKQARVNYCGC